MTFSGFPPEAITFYEGLEADNSRAYWQAHRDVYERAVRAPFEALLADLDDRFGPFGLFRPYRDVRFSKDKSPYKTSIAAVGQRDGRASVYLQLSADGLVTGAGSYGMAADQLERYRRAVDNEVTGGELADRVAVLRQAGYEVGAHERLKTAPRGYPRDHPRADLLALKGLAVFRSWPVAPWLQTARARARVVEAWEAAEPVCRWLDEHVGASEDVDRGALRR